MNQSLFIVTKPCKTRTTPTYKPLLPTKTSNNYIFRYITSNTFMKLCKKNIICLQLDDLDVLSTDIFSHPSSNVTLKYTPVVFNV